MTQICLFWWAFEVFFDNGDITDMIISRTRTLFKSIPSSFQKPCRHQIPTLYNRKSTTSCPSKRLRANNSARECIQNLYSRRIMPENLQIKNEAKEVKTSVMMKTVTLFFFKIWRRFNYHQVSNSPIRFRMLYICTCVHRKHSRQKLNKIFK